MELLPYNISISVLYPSNTDSESFRVKAVGRMDETRLIADSFGLFTPQEVAEAHVKDIENGNCSTSMGLGGWMLGIATAGASPEPSVSRAFIQVLLAGVCRFVALVYLGNFNRIVKKHYQQRQLQQELQESGQ
ncbi:3-ketodihydrosphingosine reductase domain protein [Ancylostoma caninum]|uniref:3-ketodihydrosphingosine reductase domain protein n=1 Tax=Ancylostoma caninum TaxID=29170 RepID=A0A368G895_ANCCA|nr:3-ketodihydrosphingosine reductase domain protein [Ancylostoma caninum]